ncbi:hypothetical protein SCHPADRAFT_994956 [Schizopora paradoxa]|uniref:BTB domain-containing protein n=1 Tax=Schizopora paradoxa TaxID=27342 RepID=A0A0H2S4R3_9AGAM|nr:hypothetical protein SCHPADRAFT_994956 [Schizopora paradoxa]
MDVDAQHGESTKAPKPHDILWFSDGSVVLATDLYLFKVHKTVLSLHSSVFKDMFDFPGVDGLTNGGVISESAQDMYEGLPLVTLVGYSGEDVAHLLRAVYEPRYYDSRRNQTPLPVVIALLTLSTKYDFKTIRSDIILTISRYYSIDFPVHMSVATGDQSFPLFGVERWDCHFPLLAAAFKCNADVLLPSLYSVCSGFQLEHVLDMSKTLPPECSRALILGRERLRSSLVTLALNLPGRVQKGIAEHICPDEESCLSTVGFINWQSAEVVNALLGYECGIAFVYDTLGSVCERCGVYLANEIDVRWNVIWRNVPSYFELPDWSVLREQLKELKKT